MKRGVPTLENPHRVCDKGKALTGEQAQLLKLLGEKLVVFRVGLLARWDATSGEVVQVESRCTEMEREGEADEDEDEEMSE
jgi:mRNA turnover protein 4